MDLFLILQIFFDAALLFGILFLFHFSSHQMRKKKEESDILKDIQVQEIKENLQELLITLKQLGKEVSDNIQEQVNLAETKTEAFKKIILKLQKDLNKVMKLSDELNSERIRLEEKTSAIEAAKNNFSKALPEVHESLQGTASGSRRVDSFLKGSVNKSSSNLGFDNSGKKIKFSPKPMAEIYRLADLKMGVNEIAQHTKLNHAEVQLILNLRVNRFAASELSAAKS